MKQIKIGFLVFNSLKDLIASIIIICLVLLYFLSPNVYLVTTARYNKGTEEDNQNVKIALGNDNLEQKFLLYFQWYNVIHELGHGILIFNSNLKIDAYKEEQLVNDFAVAYWLKYGEEEKIELLNDIVNYASNHIKSDAKESENYLDFAKKNWNENSFNTFNNYGWFQFNSVKESLKNKKTLEQVLDEMEIKDYNIPEAKKLKYDVINEKVSTQIIQDAVDNFHSWNLKFPKTFQSFNNDPNANYSRNGKNFLGIYDIINFFRNR